MEFWDVIQNRRSVRKFKKDEIPDEEIKKILRAAHIAPSGSNQKNWHFIVIKSDDMKNRMVQALVGRVDGILSKMKSAKAKNEFSSYSGYFTFFKDAPCVIAVVMKPYDSTTVRILKIYDKESTYSTSAGIESVSAAIENMLLAAAALGLGACWMTGPLVAKEALEKELKISPPNELVALIPLGHPLEKPRPNNLPEDVSGIMSVM